MSLLGEEHTGVVDAVLLLSFGGPEGPEQVMPFLENVTGGRGIPRERLAAVAEHYLHFGGVSPINGINRELITALEAEIDLPVYFGNRNWAPYVEDTVAAMRDNGIRRAAVFTTSAWGGYSSCTQYVEDIARARTAAGLENKIFGRLPDATWVYPGTESMLRSPPSGRNSSIIWCSSALRDSGRRERANGPPTLKR